MHPIHSFKIWEAKLVNISKSQWELLHIIIACVSLSSSLTKSTTKCMTQQVEIYWITNIKDGNPRSRCLHGCFFSDSCKREFLASSLLLVVWCQTLVFFDFSKYHSDHLPSHSNLHECMSISKFPFLQKTPFIVNKDFL